MPLILGTNSVKDTGFDVANSCRFNDDDSAYMHKTPGGAGNRRKFTISAWVKRGQVTTNSFIFSAWTADNDAGHFAFGFESAERLTVDTYSTNLLTTTRTFTDPSAWYHVVCAIDTENDTANNRVRLYVNGVEETSFATRNNPTEDVDLQANNAVIQAVGTNYYNSQGNVFYDGYMAEFCMIDNQQLTPTSFGEFDSDSGIWKPIDVSGLTFGTNGFYLDFEASGNLGNDANGGTDLTEVNLAATDQTTDTCTNNFITLNPLVGVTSQTDNQVYSEGNTIIIPNSTDNYGTGFSTIGLKGGKWYWEAQIVWNGTSNNANFPRTIGFCTENYLFNYSYLGQDEESWGIIFADASTDIWRLEHGGSSDDISGATTMANGGTMNLALDLDNGKFYVGYNGTFFTSGDPTSGATGTGAIATLSATDLSKFLFPAVTNATNSTYYKFNFGNPAYAISSGNQDGDGFGNFEYAVPSGYFSINTKNLAEYG